MVSLTDASENVVATYEYDAYGNLQSSSGAEANNNPFRFSTKYFDNAAGFYDYGFRFYDPVTGRWLSRDPIQEDGGFNLYAFVGNGPVNATDEYGLAVIELRWRDVIGGVNHAYLLIWDTDTQGNKRGTPRYFGGYKGSGRDESPLTLQKLTAKGGYFVAGTPEWEPTDDGKSERIRPITGKMVVLHDNKPADYYLKICHKVAGGINANNYMYPLGGSGFNSNTVARTYLWAIGIEYPFYSKNNTNADLLPYWNWVFTGSWAKARVLWWETSNVRAFYARDN